MGNDIFFSKLKAILNDIEPIENPENVKRAEDRVLIESIRKEARVARTYMTDTIRENSIKLIDATLDNYKVECEGQRKALELAKRYSVNAHTVADNGNGLVLFGGLGTGKDHLMMGIAKRLYYHHKSVLWTDGLRLKARMVRFWSKDSESALDVIRELTDPDFLWISDPIIQGEPLTPQQRDFFYGIVNARYMAKKPTLLTINVKNGPELDAVMGAATADRLKDGSYTHYCDWPSWRGPLSINDLPLKPAPRKFDMNALQEQAIRNGDIPNPNMGTRPETAAKLKKLKPFVSAE